MWVEGLPLQNKKWPLHSETSPGQKNVAPPALVDRSKIYLPAFHMKLGLTEISVGVMDKWNEEFDCVRENEVKMKEGIFIGP